MDKIKKTAVIQDNFGHEVNVDDLFADAITDFREHNKPQKGEGLKKAAQKQKVTDVKLYIKPCDNKAYYVVNEDGIGTVDLF